MFTQMDEGNGKGSWVTITLKQMVQEIGREIKTQHWQIASVGLHFIGCVESNYLVNFTGW